MLDAQTKLIRHRAKAIKSGKSASEYAAMVGLSPQRIGRLANADNPATPTLAEAVALDAACKIKPALWLRS